MSNAFDGLPPRPFRLHLYTSGLPYGMPLRDGKKWVCSESQCIRDVVRGAGCRAGCRTPDFQHRFNGDGEPLDNYDNVMRFLHLVSSPEGMNVGMRHISLSTCGLVDAIYRLADEKLQLTLSVSLHAPNDAIRSTMMPINRKWNVEALLKACRYYTETTKRRISFEYAMIDGVNDTDACARELAGRLKGSCAM